jgi:hypothetical protein
VFSGCLACAHEYWWTDQDLDPGMISHVDLDKIENIGISHVDLEKIENIGIRIARGTGKACIESESAKSGARSAKRVEMIANGGNPIGGEAPVQQMLVENLICAYNVSTGTLVSYVCTMVPCNFQSDFFADMV